MTDDNAFVLPEPILRPAPPWAMQEMIEAEPKLAADILGDRTQAGALAEQLRSAASAGAVMVTGCGSSEHAALAVAAQLDVALGGGNRAGRVAARQAFEMALEPGRPVQVLGISHEASTAATTAALAAARNAGAGTSLITANPGGPTAVGVDQRLVTPLLDRSWCHTVGYLSPVLTGGNVAAALAGTPADGAALAAHLRAVLSDRERSDEVGRALAGARRFVICGSGIDAISARELALKIEEGVRLPAVGRDTETELHGHLGSADADAALVVIVTDPVRTEPRAARAAQLLGAARALGMPTAAIVAGGADASWPSDLTNAGRIRLPNTPGSVALTLAALAGSAVALQLLTLSLVHVHGTNPDRIGREEPDQADAAEIASSSFPL